MSELKEGKLIVLVDDLTEIDENIRDKQYLTELEKPVNDLLGLYNELEIAEKSEIKLSKALSTLEGINTAIEKKSAFIAIAEVKFKEGMGDTCPLCNSKLK